MLKVNIYGWSKDFGPYDFSVPFDEQRNDWEIRFPDGDVYCQVEPYRGEAHDWNCDGDIYSQEGIWFKCAETNRGEFFTPFQMVQMVIEDYAEIPGLDDPLKQLKKARECQQQESAEKDGFTRPIVHAPER